MEKGILSPEEVSNMQYKIEEQQLVLLKFHVNAPMFFWTTRQSCETCHSLGRGSLPLSLPGQSTCMQKLQITSNTEQHPIKTVPVPPPGSEHLVDHVIPAGASRSRAQSIVTGLLLRL